MSGSQVFNKLNYSGVCKEMAAYAGTQKTQSDFNGHFELSKSEIYGLMEDYLAASSLSRIYKPFHWALILSSLSARTLKVSSSSICSSTNQVSRLSTL